MSDIGVEIDRSAWNKFQGKLVGMWRNVDDEMDKIVEDNAKFLLDQIRANISSEGLIETGEYLASWHIERTGKTSFKAATSHPAAHRLEYGFVGVDALGRHYADPPRPHLRPAEQATIQRFREDTARGVRSLWRRS